MPYDTPATSRTPALIIYLLDMSGSMQAEIEGVRKIDLVSSTLMHVGRQMVLRAMKGSQPAPRYRVAIFSYNDQPKDLFGGAVSIMQFVETGVPVMKPGGITNTAAAFEAAEQLLIKERTNLHNCPAPLVCHLTDGKATGTDPEPVATRIRQMRFPDGHVLVENIFFDADALVDKVDDPYAWNGVSSEGQLSSDTARKLMRMSSPIPASYLEQFGDRGYAMDSNSFLLFPGDTPEMIEMAFTMSGMTPTT